MLKKLRLKFVLINMTIVTIMLGVIFGLLYYSTSRNMERESLQMMRSIAVGPTRPEPPMVPRDNIRLPFFIIQTDRDTGDFEAAGDFFDLSDREQLSSILALATDAETEVGVLKEYKLRFARSETPTGQRFVFADMTSEQSTLRNLVRTFSMIGIAAFLIFLGISILLARWAVKPVDLAWQQQKQFVADASHELKTPLTVITTDAELLHSPECPETDREPLSGDILTMSSQMRGLVENLLDLARIDSGNVKEEFSSVSFSEIILEASAIFEPVFFEKEMSLQYEVEPDISVRGIAGHLSQLIGILMDNACKYAITEGQTNVALRRSAHRRCLLEVSNQGEPLSQDELKNIFKRFYRADKARAMNHSYGLGLSIAQGIAEEHGGKIWAVSEDGYNRFFVELPCHE